MNYKNTSIPDVILIEPEVICDERGFFLETYQAKVYADAGITAKFVQDNQSGSGQGTLRGCRYLLEKYLT
jgi:dTDP-4-dehydrorhamnose 3,5-epimerase